MNHQDWKQIILSKNKSQLKKEEKKETVLANKKCNSNKSHGDININKLESDDVKAPGHIPISISKEIQQARCAMKMTQQDLANKLCVKKNLINELESGKMFNNKSFIRKVKNILKIK